MVSAMTRVQRAPLLLALLVSTARAQHASTAATTERDPIRTHVITLDVYAPRYSDFLERNPHLVEDLQTWKGVDGRKMGYKKLVADGIMTQALVDSKQTSEGMGGVSLSHRKIWEHVAATDELALMVEDDVYTHPEIREWGEAHREGLEAADITLCGFNTDSFTFTKDLVTGYATFQTYDPPAPSADWIKAALAGTNATDGSVHIARLSNAFGVYCYWISPKGANKLKDGILPLTLDHVFTYNKDVPGGWPPVGKPPVLFMPFNPIKTIVQNSIDVRLNRIYDEIDAYVLAPRPLAYTENDKTKSQVDPRNKWDPPPKGPTLTPGMNSEMRMGGVGGGGGTTGVDLTRAGRTTKASVDPHGGAASTAPSSTTSSQGYA